MVEANACIKKINFRAERTSEAVAVSGYTGEARGRIFFPLVS
jgi:hypothetical protein